LNQVRIITEDKPRLRKRLLWFVGIYAASVLAFGAVSGFLELLLPR
jgi:hypothetical protein